MDSTPTPNYKDRWGFKFLGVIVYIVVSNVYSGSSIEI